MQFLLQPKIYRKKITPVAEGSQSNTVTITGANAALANVSFQLMTERITTKKLTVTGTTIGTLSTGGVILNTNVINNDAMTAINIGHAH